MSWASGFPSSGLDRGLPIKTTLKQVCMLPPSSRDDPFCSLPAFSVAWPTLCAGDFSGVLRSGDEALRGFCHHSEYTTSHFSLNSEDKQGVEASGGPRG